MNDKPPVTPPASSGPTFQLERQKLIFDSFKHLTTLSTGSILLLATFLKDIFKQPEWKILIAFTFVSFIVSIISSVLTMKFLAYSVGQKTDNTFQTVGALAYVVSIAGFVLGITLFAVFSFKNLP